ncbi:unnamed protein product [Lactuca saligna]|uniref:Uncharacterized protein n=1 Tax=Lactuca saligna TaxID=75948 RepID=A0AA35V2W9_LACSI|nr:unnamed protein product [Lactuca saligna]
MMSLPTTRKLALKNKIVFGTGDYWHSPTLTANMGFVRAVSQTGMSLFTFEHRPRALTVPFQLLYPLFCFKLDISSISAMEQLEHFSHNHPLNLVQLQPNHNEEEEEEEDVDDLVVEDHHVGQCNMCEEDIYSFHLCYYTCKNCSYSLHKFCAEIPKTLHDHPLHNPNHNLTLSKGFPDPDLYFSSNKEWTCGLCNHKRNNFFNYHCSICKFNMDIICATMSQQKINHPSHHHQLQRNPKKLVSICNACGREHEGTFYHCTTCYWFWIHQNCALSPTKLLIQQPTNHTLTHAHPLTLTYSFPNIDQKVKFYPKCRICDTGFYIYFWVYRCDKCRYYVHIHCATSKYDQFLRPEPSRI